MQNDIKDIILQIISEYDYKSVILFGSRARNDYKEDSDYDLLVIMQDNLSLQKLREIQKEIRKELALKDIDADVLVKTQTIINDYKSKKGNVIYNALKEGIQLLWKIQSI